MFLFHGHISVAATIMVFLLVVVLVVIFHREFVDIKENWRRELKVTGYPNISGLT